MIQKNVLIEKAREAVDSVLPIALIVSVLCLFLVPVGSGLMLAFLVGTGMILAGMALFTLGSEQSMSQMGNLVGARLTKSKNILLILVLSFIMGAVITMSEPDLQVLATYVPGIDRMTLVLTVSVGVGLFLMVCMVRILLGFALRWLLLAFYAAVFLLAFRSDPGFLSVSFDSGGVTTGPMTVPFIMALGVGVASIRSDEKAKDDSFGLVALCSIGPILAVMLLGLLYPGSTGSTTMAVEEFAQSTQIGWSYLEAIPEYMAEVLTALAPIFVFFLLFQMFTLRLPAAQLARIAVGILYTYVGLVLFLTGVNVGFASLGYTLGGEMVRQGMGLLLIPLAVLMGWFIINAEPAVHVLNKQVEDLTSGAISAHRQRPGHDPGADRPAHPVFRGAGVPGGPGPHLRGAPHLHRHRLRLGRGGLGPHDRHLYAALCHGRLRRPGRQHHDRRLRPGGPGGHDAPDHRPDHGRRVCGQAAPVGGARRGRAPAGLCRRRDHRAVGGGCLNGAELRHQHHRPRPDPGAGRIVPEP